MINMTKQNMDAAVAASKIVALLHKETKGPAEGFHAMAITLAFLVDTEQREKPSTREDKVKTLAIFMALALTFFPKDNIKMLEVYDAVRELGTDQ